MVMTNNTLLPPTASLLERNLSESCHIQLNVDLRFLWDPSLCPVNWLPFLAWQYSVDRWDENWTEQVKRKVIADSFLTHKLKGTIKAIKRAVEPFGYIIRINEWFNTNNEAGTFSLEIDILDKGITEDDYTELTRIIDDVRAYSRHITELSIVLVSQGTVNLRCLTTDGDILTVTPYIPVKVILSGNIYCHIATYSTDLLEVTP
jgi:phage tail P2-like protein